MDTRTKIVALDEALRLAVEGSTIVSGYFDPMLRWHAERLAEVKRATGSRLLVAIAEPENPILPNRARAELVAALACVDHVVEFTDSLDPAVRLEREDAASQERLIEHVHQRQQAAI